jgi:multicomponent K+:H+ antiporter subunit A
MLCALLLVPLIASALVAWIGARRPRAAAWIAGAAALACCATVGALAPEVLAGEVVRATVPWIEGADFSLRMDGLAFAFALLVAAIGALVVLYGAYYLAPEDPPGRFFATLLAFMAAMLGVVLAGNLIVLVVFWELTSVTSFLLIGFWRQRADARQGARMALAVTGAGGLALFAGVLLLGHIVGSYDLDRVLASGAIIRAHPWYVPALVLVLAGAFTKSAQFPFHFWLPHAMAAPTPVSAYLHSATMVKAGVFLLARLYPALGSSEPWFYIVGTTGLVTLVLGAVIALFQQDLKGLLAYSTISHLGLITLLFGLDSPLAVVAGVFHILNHAAFKASLFMAAGIIDHETGSRDMRRLNGLWKAMPVTGALAIVASAAMAGVPLLNGFLSKEMFFAETLFIDAHRAIEWVVPAAATLAAVFSVAYSLRFIHDVFFNGSPVDLPKAPHEPPRWMRLPVEALVAVCVAVGVLPGLTVGPLLHAAARGALDGPPPEYNLALWHGFNAPLLMSAVAVAGGAALYFGLQRTINLHSVTRLPVGGKHAFDALMAALQRAADALGRGLPYASLPRMLTWLTLAVLAAGGMHWLAGTGAAPPRRLSVPGADDTALGEVAILIWVLAIAAAVAATVRHRQRFTALIFVGVTGLMVSLAFVLLSAPDLALTQLLVEVVTVVLMMVVLHFLPQSAPPEPSRARRVRDAAIAAVAGVGITGIVHAVLTRPLQSIAPYYLERALPEGGGTNAVNVIIVDFRGFDTLGEIAVLGIAALIVHALLGRFRVPADVAVDAGAPDWNPLLVGVVARTLLPLATTVAIYLYLRGHNLPGGGFAAGLVFASAVLVTRFGRPLGRLAPLATVYPFWIGIGLLVATATGIGSAWFGHPFLTSSFAHPVLPLIGEVPLATAALFDLGVFIVVVGATLLALLVPGLLADPVRAASGPKDPR